MGATSEDILPQFVIPPWAVYNNTPMYLVLLFHNVTTLVEFLQHFLNEHVNFKRVFTIFVHIIGFNKYLDKMIFYTYSYYDIFKEKSQRKSDYLLVLLFSCINVLVESENIL